MLVSRTGCMDEAISVIASAGLGISVNTEPIVPRTANTSSRLIGVSCKAALKLLSTASQNFLMLCLPAYPNEHWHS